MPGFSLLVLEDFNAIMILFLSVPRFRQTSILSPGTHSKRLILLRLCLIRGKVMTLNKFLFSAGLALAFAMCVAVDDGFAQGRGGGRPAGAGPPATSGRPAGIGVDRGLGNASVRSGGRSDDGLGNASNRSNGRSTSGLNRARLARSNANSVSDTELNRYRGLSRKLGTTPEEMRARFETALLANPDLKYGQFVAAHMVADNHVGRFPGITAPAILEGFANGDSLGRTLRNLGMTKDQAKLAERDAEMRIDSAKKRN